MTRSLRSLILMWSVVVALVIVAFGCGSSSATLSTIEIAPATATIAKDATQQYKATGKYSDDSTKDITALVSWSSSDVAVATISDDMSSKGVATGVAKGSATITASLDDGGNKITGSAALTVADAAVTLASIALTPATPSLAKGTMIDLTATGTYSDGTTKDVTAEAAWSSSDATVATADKGVVTAILGGSVTITAAVGEVKGTTSLTVTTATLAAIEVTSPDGWIAKGMQVQFTATGVFSDESKQNLTKQATWASSSPSVTISNAAGSQGVGNAATEGVAMISATLMGVSGSMSFGVTSATLESIDVTPFDPSIAKGTAIAFSATGILSDHTLVDLTPFAAWASSDDEIAKLGGGLFGAGVATGVEVGTVTINATYKDLTGSTTLTVSAATLSKVNLVPLNPTLAKGTAAPFRAIGTFSDDTAQDLTALATWGSSNVSTATVSNAAWSHGVVTALAEGTTIISASIGSKSDSTTLTVSPAVLTSIAVTPSFPSIAKGTSLQLAATGVYSDKTTQDLTAAATWSSTDASVSVSNAGDSVGVVSGASQGASIVKATFGGVTGGTTVTVTSATLVSIEVTPPNPSIAKGTSVWLDATGIYSDKTTQDLTKWVAWTSADASVAVSNAFDTHGLALGQVQGSAVVTATFMGGVSGSTTVTVTAATLVSLDVTPDDPTIAKGTTVQLKVVGTYTDNAKQDLTFFATWLSSDASVAMSGGLWTAGLAVGVSQGEATVTAHYGGKSASTTITVTAATLASLALTPADASLAKGTAMWMAVTGTYTDGTTQDLSALATWSSSDDTKVVISNAAGARGLATGVGVGTATITADFGGKSGSTSVTVTAATLSMITVVPANASVAKNGTKQFSALGMFTDNTVQNITTMVYWSSSDAATAIVSNATGSQGLVTGVAPGTATVTASLAGKVGSTELAVTP